MNRPILLVLVLAVGWCVAASWNFHRLYGHHWAAYRRDVA